MEFEVVEFEGEGPIRRAADEATDLIDECRAAIAGEPHDFVLTLVHGEAEIGREGRVEHSERMGKPDFTQQGDRGGTIGTPRAEADRQRGPFADAVRRQDRRPRRGRREESGSRMRLVMLREQDLARRHAQIR